MIINITFYNFFNDTYIAKVIQVGSLASYNPTTTGHSSLFKICNINRRGLNMQETCGGPHPNKERYGGIIYNPSMIVTYL